MKKNNRTTPRVKIHDVVSYTCMEPDGTETCLEMGMVIDISQAGMLIEVSEQYEASHLLITATDENDDLISIRAKIIHTNKCHRKIADGFGQYEIGVEFEGAEAEIRSFVSHFVKAYSQHENARKINFTPKTEPYE